MKWGIQAEVMAFLIRELKGGKLGLNPGLMRRMVKMREEREKGGGKSRLTGSVRGRRGSGERVCEGEM